MKLLLILLVGCPIALFYLVPRYLKLREKYILLQKKHELLKEECELLQKNNRANS